MSTLIISVLIALAVSGLCSLTEAVLLSLTPGDLAELTRNYPKTGERWTQLKQNIEKPIAVILILNTTAHTIGAAVAGASFSDVFGNKWIWLFSLIFTFLMLQYTEILPKTLGVRFNRRLARLFARPLIVLMNVFSPLIKFTYFLNRPFEFRGKKMEQRSTVDEINLMAAYARRYHQIGVQQEHIILGATKLSLMKVREIMLPFDEVVMLSCEMPLIDAIELAHMDAHTRFPVFKNNDKNNIVGYVNFKEIIGHQRLNPRANAFAEIIRPITFVDPNSSASDLLRLFMVQHEHIAIVRNSDKKCIGLITLEDIVEELVGEIEDEFDRLPKLVHILSKNILLIGGGCPMKTVAETLQNNFDITLLDSAGKPLFLPENSPESSPKGNSPAPASPAGNQDTKVLASWLAEKIDHPVSRGDQIVDNGLLYTVRRIRRQRVFDVQIQKINENIE
ncbi:MAG: CNNM domain-containing protein [Planctomycetia bacterium]|nr:CNNM domain-containing protein [Planctomycetia bacterium]